VRLRHGPGHARALALLAELVSHGGE
jgi:hypothetical protein